MVNDIRQFIKIVDIDLNEKFNIIERIANSDPQDLISIIEQMDEDRIDEITELLSVINEGDNISEDLRDTAKAVWKTALKGAKNLVTGRAFNKLVGVAKRLLNRNDVLKKWEKYKGRFNIQGDNPKDIKRFIKTEFPTLSDNTVRTAQRQVKFKLDSDGNVTNFSNFIDGLARVAGEVADEKVTTGTITKKEPEAPPIGATAGEQKSAKKMTLGQALKTSAAGEKGYKGSSSKQNVALAASAVNKAISRGHIDKKDMVLIANTVRTSKFNSITDKKIIRSLAAIAYHLIKQ